jgi:hypothetical protein
MEIHVRCNVVYFALNCSPCIVDGSVLFEFLEGIPCQLRDALPWIRISPSYSLSFHDLTLKSWPDVFKRAQSRGEWPGSSFTFWRRLDWGVAAAASRCGPSLAGNSGTPRVGISMTETNVRWWFFYNRNITWRVGHVIKKERKRGKEPVMILFYTQSPPITN